MLPSFIGIFFLAAGSPILLAAGCAVLTNSSGSFESSADNFYSYQSACWDISVRDGHYVDLMLNGWRGGYVTITGKIETAGSRNIIVMDSDFRNKNVTIFDDVTVSVRADRIQNFYYPSYYFGMSYKIEDIVCARGGSVRCGDDSCVPKDKVCDGIDDCDNGKDEENCKFGRDLVAGLNDRLSEGVSWLKGQMKEASETWKKDTPRAITALYLADGVTLNGTCDEDEALVQELEVKTAVAVMRNASNPVLPGELAMLIHGLLVTCYDPRHFYGFDLVRILDDQLAGSPNDPAIPLASLALCNAGQSTTKANVEGLLRMLDSSSDHSFLLDVQAVALMALSCIRNRGGHPDVNSSIDSTAARFEKLQHPDGSFGNIYTTALVAQALMGAKGSDKWKVSLTLKYLMRQQANDSSFGDFLATYLVLPVLNDRSLVDIAKINCSSKKRKPKEEDILPDVDKKPEPKMTVKYSLYIGEDPDVVPTISLRVPGGQTAYQIMQTAAKANPKFEFECHVTKGKMYVFSIAGVANDPELDKFWLFYLDRHNDDGELELITKGPDRIEIYHGQHIIMWYKKKMID